MMQEFAGKPVRAFVIWEPVLPTDWSSPSTTVLSRITNGRTAQFWDKQRLISQSMGEHDGKNIVWDHIAVYPAGAVWEDRPPQALYRGGPVVGVIQPARAALTQAFEEKRAQVQ